MSDVNAALDAILERAPVLPVLTVGDVESAVALGSVLRDAGLPVVEVTLRTPAALDAIRALRDRVDGLEVGAGTIVTPADLERAREAGATFAVSPGATEALYRAAADSTLPLLPGVATASEIMAGLGHGWRRFKFFPAGASGGVAALRAFGGPLARVRFCPTGGIGPDNFGDYLALANVMTVGGSWMVPADAVASGDWSRIETLARECAERAAADRPATNDNDKTTG
ncbi:MAG: bifunctional 4-hydroxy-2-oxoglutarate aldolase/2-dehydro-3-deoxy-phosphogluconate aldolase [Wenzhouxiangellaceae bacterium]|nr:bifunctional 4-hydroxy-2-oxoglutarate aldolase/2-dehydro-3-deoxy-phosphogluconate aldolase [Wenzhouxiangellaceae bacterium]